MKKTKDEVMGEQLIGPYKEWSMQEWTDGMIRQYARNCMDGWADELRNQVLDLKLKLDMLRSEFEQERRTWEFLRSKGKEIPATNNVDAELRYKDADGNKKVIPGMVGTMGFEPAFVTDDLNPDLETKEKYVDLGGDLKIPQRVFDHKEDEWDRLLQEFMEWYRNWRLYEDHPLSNKRPPIALDFIAELKKRYSLIEIEEKVVQPKSWYDQQVEAAAKVWHQENNHTGPSPVNDKGELLHFEKLPDRIEELSIRGLLKAILRELQKGGRK